MRPKARNFCALDNRRAVGRHRSLEREQLQVQFPAVLQTRCDAQKSLRPACINLARACFCDYERRAGASPPTTLASPFTLLKSDTPRGFECRQLGREFASRVYLRSTKFMRVFFFLLLR